jgi:hypothetical protein
MDILGREIKKERKPKVNMSPNIALVGVGGMVPSMVRAIEDITSTKNITKNRGLFLALLRGEKSKKGRINRRIRAKLNTTKPKNLSGIDLNMV